MMVQANQETPIPRLANSKHPNDTAESSSSYMPKNYAFMVNHKSGKGVSIIEQVRNMLHAHQIYSNNLEPALEKISNTCVDALAAYQRVLEERDDGDLARSDNVRLNKLIDQLYHATEVFKSPANTNSSENSFNWGWASKIINKNYPICSKQSPFFQYPSNEYDNKHDENTTTNIPVNESETATSESNEGIKIPFSYFSEADTAESSKLSTPSVPFMPRHMTTVTNYPSSSSQQHSFLEKLQCNCVTEELNPCSMNKEKVVEEIAMEKPLSNIIIKNDFNKILIRNRNVANTSNLTSEPSCSDTNSYVDVLQHNLSNNLIKISLEKLKGNYEESDSLNDSLSDSSPREIFQKGKGKNLTKNGVKPTLNRKDLRSPRSHARFEKKNCFYTQKKPEVNSTFIAPSHTRKYFLPHPENQDDEWLIDSACSMHMTGRLEFLRDYREVSFGGYVTFGNDANGIIKGYGVLTNGNFTIQKVPYVLRIKHNLINVGQLVTTGLRVEFDNEFSYIMTS
ncbi:hypothetical protein L1887_17816 [Cichorium endivia]|nr:hypothetical protein L1887_17816 [Cichorium endivia]